MGITVGGVHLFVWPDDNLNAITRMMNYRQTKPATIICDHNAPFYPLLLGNEHALQTSLHMVFDSVVPCSCECRMLKLIQHSQLLQG